MINAPEGLNFFIGWLERERKQTEKIRKNRNLRCHLHLNASAAGPKISEKFWKKHWRERERERERESRRKKSEPTLPFALKRVAAGLKITPNGTFL